MAFDEAEQKTIGSEALNHQAATCPQCLCGMRVERYNSNRGERATAHCPECGQGVKVQRPKTGGMIVEPT
jgi:uncharacterized paraquat-inducible protein A